MIVTHRITEDGTHARFRAPPVGTLVLNIVIRRRTPEEAALEGAERIVEAVRRAGEPED